MARERPTIRENLGLVGTLTLAKRGGRTSMESGSPAGALVGESQRRSGDERGPGLGTLSIQMQSFWMHSERRESLPKTWAKKEEKQLLFPRWHVEFCW